jgi:hypothetical protein
MGYWGVKSYEGDEASDALDAAFQQVHGDRYDELMDDGNPMPFDEVQLSLADPRTLAVAVEALAETFGSAPSDAWDDEQRLAFAGVVVRHAEAGVPIPGEQALLALGWLESEAVDWDEATVRMLRRRQEIDLLTKAPRS